MAAEGIISHLPAELVGRKIVRSLWPSQHDVALCVDTHASDTQPPKRSLNRHIQRDLDRLERLCRLARLISEVLSLNFLTGRFS